MSRQTDLDQSSSPDQGMPGAGIESGTRELSASTSKAGAGRTAEYGRGLLDALRFLLPLGRLQYERPPVTGAMVAWLVPIGLLTGIMWAGSFRFAWKIYGEIAAIRVVPAMTVVLLECLVTGPFLALGLARTIHLLAGDRPARPDVDRSAPLSPLGTLILCLTVLSEWVLITSVPVATPWYPLPSDWRHYFVFMYPAPVYRPLVLAPLWGRWAILLAATVGPPARNADAITTTLHAAMSPSRLLAAVAAPLLLTSIYCSRDRNFLTGIIVGMLVFALSYLVAMVMARRGGGQTRQSLYATGQIAQLAFLAFYRAFWPLIHG